MKSIIHTLLLCLALILLLVYAPYAAAGASKGLILWFRNILPTLMPFTLLVQLLLSDTSMTALSRFLGKPIQKIFRLSPSAIICLITGFLCGFPMGAISSIQACKQQLISKREAQILCAACNNAGPMFISGYILKNQLHLSAHYHALIVIFYATPLIWLWINMHCFHLDAEHTAQSFNQIPTNTAISQHLSGSQAQTAPKTAATLETAILKTAEIMLKIGVFMMLFSILSEMLSTMLSLDASIQAVLSLLLEITTGSVHVANLPLPNAIKTALIMTGASFGGLCIVFQTYTMMGSEKLSLKKYLIDKTIISLATGTLAWILLR